MDEFAEAYHRQKTNECRAACDWYSVGNQFNGHQQCRGCGKQKDF